MSITTAAERSDLLGRFANERVSADVVAVDASPVGSRVYAVDSPGLLGLFASVEPMALGDVALVVIARGKRAIQPLPAFMPMQRDGWLVDASDRGIKLWCQPTDRAVVVDPGAFFSVAELYARVALDPFEGMLPATPGGDNTGKAPPWVDKLRIAHIELLRLVRAARLEPMQPTEGPEPMTLGTYAHEGVTVELTAAGPVPTHPALAQLFADRTALESPALLEAFLAGQPAHLPALPAALGGRPETVFAPEGDQIQIVRDGTSHLVDPELLLQLLELDLRHILAPHLGQPIARDKRPDTGAPPWVGRGWAAWGRAVGRLLGDRLQHR